jgi:GNAT superfamily N-acetyltransferase
VGADHRGVGIGGTLLGTAWSEALARGLHPVLDVVETRSNAMQLYERRGFRRVLTKAWPADAKLSHHLYIGPKP